MSDHADLVKEFLVESYENLDRLDRDLVELERDPSNVERLGSIFRTIHTLKGTVGFLGFGRLEAVSHVGENLLSRMRDQELILDVDITSGLLRMLDTLRQILRSIEDTGQEGEGDDSAVIAELARLNESSEPADEALPDEVPFEPAALEVVEMPVEVVPQAPPPRPPARAAAEPASGPWDGEERRSTVSESSLRVDVLLLDKLMNLVGELVLARNQILQLSSTLTDSAFVGATGRLNLVTSELQEGVMKTRMQPIGTVWSKFPRVVRDLATTCGKQVRIEMEGKETDLDKALIEAIKDPLTHVVRNSVDHGIEAPDVRVSRGKPAEGVLRLRAFHEGGQINIEIADDGAGIDPARVKAKALQRGIITADHAAAMSDHEAVRLIFLPGFSTAEQITNVSGRGVGMDVVKTNIEKIGGQVDIHSVIGAGTTLRIKIPLTLAIIPALIVSADGDRYAIPQVSLIELVRLEGAHAMRGIEFLDDAPFYRRRGSLLPLLYLRKELGLPASPTSDLVNIVVLNADDRQFGLVVDEINDTEEIVVKPLGKQLKRVGAFAGATIMGDGRVALILDALGVAQRAHVVSGTRERTRIDAVQATAAVSDLQTLLLFRVGNDRMALPLSLVDRLEEFPRTRIEHSGPQDVVQYRGEIMPLVSLAAFFNGADRSAADPRPAIIFGQEGARVGLLVDQILDVVTEPVHLQRRSPRPGVLGAAVVQQFITDLIDVPAILQAVVPSHATQNEAA